MDQNRFPLITIQEDFRWSPSFSDLPWLLHRMPRSPCGA